MRHALLGFFILALTIGSGRASAQVVPGTRVRVMHHGIKEPIAVGTLGRVAADTVWIADSAGPLQMVMLGKGNVLEVSTGRRTAVVQGVVAGVVLGAVVGALVGGATYEPPPPPPPPSCPPEQWFCGMGWSGMGGDWGPSFNASAGAFVGAIPGGLLGWAIGRQPREHWSRP